MRQQAKPPDAAPAPAAPPAAQAAPPAEEWKVEAARAAEELTAWPRGAPPAARLAVMRASQLDAGRLDAELASILQEQFLGAFSLMQPRVVNALKPELSLLLDSLIFGLSVWRGRPTPGNALMNLRYRDERTPAMPAPPLGGRTGVEGPGLSTGQRLAWAACFVLGRYGWARLESVAAAWRWVDAPEGSWGRRCWRALQAAEAAWRLASLANLLVFLRWGVYRSLPERLLRARLVYRRASQPRALNFEYLNRQLVWHELSELLLFLLPLVSVARLKALVRRSVPNLYRPSAAAAAAAGEGGGAGPSAAAAALQAGECGICRRADVPQPWQALPCAHAFCYFCLRSRTQAEPGFQCPACGAVVVAMRRWRPDGSQLPPG